MQFTSVVRSLGLAAAASLTFAVAGCTEPPAPSASPTTNAPQAPATNAPAPAPTPPKPGEVKAPLGMEDTIEGRVIGLRCYKDNRNASPEEAKACAEANVAKGGRLGVLGSDGTVYVNENPDAGITNQQLQPFIGQEVTIQGQMIGDAPNLNWDDVKVKKFKFGLVRRKGAPAPGTPRQVAPTPNKAEPAKKP
jgi:hypothetical protein